MSEEKFLRALGNLQSMAIDNTKGSKGVDICVSDINEYVVYLQSKIDKAIEYINNLRDESAERQEFYDCYPDDLYISNIDELLDILEENKYERGNYTFTNRRSN